jgi:hypothetical protein
MDALGEVGADEATCASLVTAELGRGDGLCGCWSIIARPWIWMIE